MKEKNEFALFEKMLEDFSRLAFESYCSSKFNKGILTSRTTKRGKIILTLQFVPDSDNAFDKAYEKFKNLEYSPKKDK